MQQVVQLDHYGVRALADLQAQGRPYLAPDLNQWIKCFVMFNSECQAFGWELEKKRKKANGGKYSVLSDVEAVKYTKCFMQLAGDLVEVLPRCTDNEEYLLVPEQYQFTGVGKSHKEIREYIERVCGDNEMAYNYIDHQMRYLSKYSKLSIKRTLFGPAYGFEDVCQIHMQILAHRVTKFTSIFPDVITHPNTSTPA